MTQTKYKQELATVQRLLPQFGVKVTVQTPEDPLAGEVGDDAILQEYTTSVVFTGSYSSRSGGGDYTRFDYLRMLMPPSDNPAPRAGDIVTTPEGRKYIVETVSIIQPDGVPLLFDVSVRDG